MIFILKNMCKYVTIIYYTLHWIFKENFTILKVKKYTIQVEEIGGERAEEINHVITSFTL